VSVGGNCVGNKEIRDAKNGVTADLERGPGTHSGGPVKGSRKCVKGGALRGKSCLRSGVVKDPIKPKNDTEKVTRCKYASGEIQGKG